jgi:RNA 3'-terminal phosphate cyclase-like protein
VIFKPGIIDSGEGLPIEHKCDVGRSITYYLECVVVLGIFGKTMMNLTLLGNTDDDADQSLESFKSAMTYLLD